MKMKHATALANGTFSYWTRYNWRRKRCFPWSVTKTSTRENPCHSVKHELFAMKFSLYLFHGDNILYFLLFKDTSTFTSNFDMKIKSTIDNVTDFAKLWQKPPQRFSIISRQSCGIFNHKLYYINYKKTIFSHLNILGFGTKIRKIWDSRHHNPTQFWRQF